MCTDKANEKSHLVIHTYNDKKKNFVLMHFPKIPGVNQGISYYLIAINRDNDNDNIKFYLWNIMQTFIETASDLNLDIYIQPLSKLKLQLSASFDSIVKVMRALYDEPKANNHRFANYYLQYKDKSQMIESACNSFLFWPPLKLLLPPSASSDCYDWKNLSAAFFLAYNSNAYIAKPGIVNRFDLRFVIKQTLNMQSYKEQKNNEIRWICSKNNPANAITKISLNSALEEIISTNKGTIRLERCVKQ